MYHDQLSTSTCVASASNIYYNNNKQVYYIYFCTTPWGLTDSEVVSWCGEVVVFQHRPKYSIIVSSHPQWRRQANHDAMHIIFIYFISKISIMTISWCF